MKQITYHLVVSKQGKPAQAVRKALAKALAATAPAFPATVRPSEDTLLVTVTLASDYDTPDLARLTAPALKKACQAAGVGYVWGHAVVGAQDDAT